MHWQSLWAATILKVLRGSRLNKGLNLDRIKGFSGHRSILAAAHASTRLAISIHQGDADDAAIFPKVM
jgi:hypothetical protein